MAVKRGTCIMTYCRRANRIWSFSAQLNIQHTTYYSLWHRGLTLDELADWMIEFQARYAINLDGGGSSVLVQNGTYVSHPTCWDVPLECERAIATVLCIK